MLVEAVLLLREVRTLLVLVVALTAGGTEAGACVTATGNGIAGASWSGACSSNRSNHT